MCVVLVNVILFRVFYTFVSNIDLVFIVQKEKKSYRQASELDLIDMYE